MVSKAAERSRSTRVDRIVYVGQLPKEGRIESEEGQFLWNGNCASISTGM